MRKPYILYIAAIISSLFATNNTSALNYQGSTKVKFAFNPTLSISISPSDLVIDSLTPGTTSDSNIINVSVATNASHGYTLSSTVGDNLHNNTNLTHTNGTSIFSSIATDASLSSLTNDNTWGYSYRLSNNNGSDAWSNYSGLSNETSKTLINTDNQAAKPIDFKIAAKAAETQPSGAYTNTINFIAISKPIPKTIEDIVYMQTFSELVETDLQSVKDSMEEEHTYTLKDARDEQDYTIAKLKDGKIWMTKNLNLAGGTEITAELSDVPAGYTLPTANGFQKNNRLPESSKTGFSDNVIAYVYSTGNNTDNCANPGCYSYYSWHAATAGSGVNITTNNTDAPYSICPKGWKLPISGANTNGSWKRGDFYTLATHYGINLESNYYADSSDIFYEKNGPSTTSNFILTGQYLANVGYEMNKYGFYWSSTSGSSNKYANPMFFGASLLYSTGGDVKRSYGFAVRCLAK